MHLGMRRAYEHGDGGRWMPFHHEERDGEDQPGSMDRISVFFFLKKDDVRKTTKSTGQC